MPPHFLNEVWRKFERHKLRMEFQIQEIIVIGNWRASITLGASMRLAVFALIVFLPRQLSAETASTATSFSAIMLYLLTVS
jgi:hypothetical protein